MTQERLFSPPPSPTAPIQDAGDYTWKAASPLGEAHAWPPVPAGRLPGRAACGSARWTVAYGHDGATRCLACIVMLRDQLRAIVVALAKAGISTEVTLERAHISTRAGVAQDATRGLLEEVDDQ